VRYALNEDKMRIKASPDAPEVATCPTCGGVVVLRSRRLSKNPDEKTWYYRHRRGESPRCSRRSGPGWR
jgi:hypothetical protein